MVDAPAHAPVSADDLVLEGHVQTGVDVHGLVVHDANGDQQVREVEDVAQGYGLQVEVVIRATEPYRKTKEKRNIYVDVGCCVDHQSELLYYALWNLVQNPGSSR